MKSRINITNIVAFVTAVALMLTEQGVLAASISGFIIYFINVAVVAIGKMTMTKDPYILGTAIVGLIVSAMQGITDYAVLPNLNPFYFNMVLSILLIALRYFSATDPERVK